MIKYLIVFVFTTASLLSWSQTCELEGRVLDDHGHLLPGATIQNITNNSAVSTNELGRYKISVSCEKSVSVKVSFIGFTSVDTLIVVENGNYKMDVILPSKEEHLHEFIISEHKHSDHISVGNEEVSATYIKENDKGTLMKTLEQIPGVNAINVGVGISKPVLRGMSANRVVVTGRGVKQEGQQWGGDHGLEMDQFDVEHVEIIKGPSTLKYGSGSAAGVINVLSPSIAAQDSIEGTITGVYKSNNNHIGASGGLKWHKKDWFGQARFTYQEFGDYRVPADSFTYNSYQLPIENQRLKNTAGQEMNYSADLGIIKSWGTSIISASSYNLKAGIFPGAVGIPRSFSLASDGDSRNIDLPSQEVNHHKIMSKSKIYKNDNKTKMELTAAWQQNIRDESSEAHSHGSSVNTSNQALLLDLQTISFDFLVEHRQKARLKHETGLNFQYRNNRVGGFEFLIPAYNSIDLGAFYVANFQLTDQIEVNGGVRLGYFELSAPESIVYGSADSTSNGSVVRTPEIDKNIFNWTAAIGLQYQWTKAHLVKVNLNKSYRNPSIAELGSNGIHHGTFRHEVGDPNLNQEQGVHADLGWEFSQRKTKLKLTVFGSYYQNFIYLKPTAEFSVLPEGGQVFRYTQNNAVYTGGELKLEQDILKNWIVGLGIDYVWNKNLDTRLPLPFTPPGRLLAEVKYQWKRKKKIKLVEPVIGYRYTLAQTRVDRNELETPAFHLFQLGLNVHALLGNRELQFRCMIQNVFNTNYMNHLSRYRYLNIPEQGRNVVVGLDIPLGICLKKKNNI